MKRILLLLFTNFILFSLSYSQINFRIDEGSVMTISGTSTIHDWTSKVNEIKGEYVLKETIKDKKLPKSGGLIEKIRMVIPVLSIESPRGETMDNKTYNALKSDEFPELVFEAKMDNLEQVFDKEGSRFLLMVTGNLTLAGSTKEVTISLEGERLPSGKLKFKGAYPIDMVEYNIEPPTAMFGQIKTGKDVVVDFDLILSEI